MAKPHKFAGDGLDIETTLTFEQLANLAQRAAQESTGDPARGRQRISSVRSSDRQIEFRISDFGVSFKKLMVFRLDFEPRHGRTRASSRIGWYLTTRDRVGGFIPVASKSMVAHHTYLQFVHSLAEQVRLADPLASLTVRAGGAETGLRPEAPATAPTPSAQSVSDFRPPPAAPVTPTTHPDPPDASGLVTSVPGMPRREPSTAPSGEVVAGGYASIAEQLFAEDESLFHTRLVQQSDAALPWTIRLPDGREHAIETALVLGRNPLPPPGSAAVPLALDDPQRSVSKTHALLEIRDGLPWVTDLNSTNGTTLTNDLGEALTCDPATAVPVGDGWVVELGEYGLTTLRRAPD